MWHILHDFLGDEQGADAIEYAMLSSLVLLTILAAVNAAATGTTVMWSKIAVHV
ncbi:MAG TPA: Flp family type IVb pilin [Deltaproteobacteria bacterium]|nr:Flp family type IVb pilin [Deltaproteobacteria bacterium]